MVTSKHADMKFTNLPHFYFWLTLPVTLLIIAAYIGVQILFVNYQHKHPNHEIQFVTTLVFQLASLVYLLYLQQKLWQQKDKTALIIFGILGVCTLTVSIPLELITLLVLYVCFVSTKPKAQ